METHSIRKTTSRHSIKHLQREENIFNVILTALCLFLFVDLQDEGHLSNLYRKMIQKTLFFTRGLTEFELASLLYFWWAQEDLNLRPPGYEPGALAN